MGGEAREIGPDPKWIDDWMVGVEIEREREFGRWFLELFAAFWISEALDQKSQTTRRRYAGGLHALGAYLIRQAVSGDNDGESAQDILWDAIDLNEAPLISPDYEVWQEKLDRTCRSLYRHLMTKGRRRVSRVIDGKE